MMDGFELPISDGCQLFYLINSCTKNVRLHLLPLNAISELFHLQNHSEIPSHQKWPNYFINTE